METRHYHIVHYQYECRAASEGLITTGRLAELSRIHPEIIQMMVEWGLVEPEATDPEPLFPETAVPLVWRIMRLRNDLGINWNGIGVVMNLLERIENLEREIARLKKII